VENCRSTVSEEKVPTMASWMLHPTVGVEFYLTHGRRKPARVSG
jgi:hypothetical protein